MDMLDGIIWTPETTWSADLAAEVRYQSDEIRPGVYQVRGRSEREPANLVTV